MTSILIRDTQRGEGHVKTEEETGVMQPQVKKHLGPPELQEARKGPPLEPSEGVWPCQHLSFRLLASRTVRE